MCDDYYYYEEQRKAEAKSEAALAGTFATAIGGIVGAVLSCALFLVRRFDILSSGLASLLFYMLTYTQGWNKVIYIVGVLAIFVVSVILQYVFVATKIIYTVFVCIVATLIGGCWKTYDSEMQRNMIMLICFAVTGTLGAVSWCRMANKSSIHTVSLEYFVKKRRTTSRNDKIER